MKVIDLLNKIANGEEVPEKIPIYNDMFIFNHSNMEYEHEKTRTDLLSIYNGYILNYEVEIIEDKKIEKIEKFTEYELKHSMVNEYILGIKINELIDKINELEENK